MDDFYTWQGKREAGRQGSRHPPAAAPPLAPAPPRDPYATIEVREHRASTTLVEQIRGALLRRLRGEHPND